MAQIQVEELVDHLSSEFRRALTDTIREVLPDADFDERAAYRVFKRAVGRKCNTWEAVPKNIIKV